MANNSLDCWPENACSLLDGPPGHLKNPLREFFKLFLRFFVNRRFRSLRRAMGALPLNPTIFREKSSKAFSCWCRLARFPARSAGAPVPATRNVFPRNRVKLFSLRCRLTRKYSRFGRALRPRKPTVSSVRPPPPHKKSPEALPGTFYAVFAASEKHRLPFFSHFGYLPLPVSWWCENQPDQL